MISNTLSNDTKMKLEIQYHKNHMFLSVFFCFSKSTTPAVYPRDVRSVLQLLERKIN